jgi:protein gp37
MENTKIEWTDHTFNAWTGCEKVSPACANCYAEGWAIRAGRDFKERIRTKTWGQPVKWNNHVIAEFPSVCHCGFSGVANKCPQCGKDWEHMTIRKPRVFCSSLADWLDDKVPIEWLADLLKLIHDTPNLDWLMLTKRPENWKSRLGFAADNLMDRGIDHVWLFEWVVNNHAPSNVWIGVTVEDQQRADERVPILLSIPARVRFLSCEPLLGPVDLWGANYKQQDGSFTGAVTSWEGCGVDWVICGGESGPNARPSNPSWVRSLRDQCAAANVPFLFKQWGEWGPHERLRVVAGTIQGFEETMLRIGKKKAGRLLDAVIHDEYPV